MTDDEILDAVERRLGGVETRLPPTPVGAAGRTLDGAMRSGPSFRSGPMPAAVIAIGLIVVALAVGARLSMGVGADASPTVESSADVASASDAPSRPAIDPSVAPSASAETLVILRGKYDGNFLLEQHFGWGPCLVGADVFIVPPDGVAVDRVIVRSGTVEGMVDAGRGGRVWVGPTPESAARGYGSPVLAIGLRGDTWIAHGASGRQLVSFQTPKGRLMWVLTGSIGECPSGSGPR